MLEQAIERLTVEVQRLRKVIERQNALAERDRTPPRAPESDAPAASASFLNEHAVAELAGVSVGLLRRWRLFRQGPPYHKLGRLVRYSRAEVLRWLDAQKGT
jgi:predicted DNA-binding transcriptional regulator AlpA